jgi:hypothetical protein
MAGWNFFLNGIEVEEPIGWDAIEFTAIRMESHGIDQPFSTEVKFYERGAKLIKALYDQYFINSEITIQITSDVGYGGEPYEFNGMLNLAIYEEFNVCDTDSWEITVGIIDDNFREQFKARQDVEIDLYALKDLNGNAIDPLVMREIRMHKQELFLAASARNYAPQTSRLQYSPVGFSPYSWDYPLYVNVVPVFFENSDFKGSFSGSFDTQGSAFTNSNVIFQNNSDYTRTLNASVSIQGRFVWDGTDNLFPGETANIRFYIRTFDSSGSFDTFYTLFNTALSTANIPVDPEVDFDFTTTISGITVLPNYRVAVLAYWGEGGSVRPSLPIADNFTRSLSMTIDNVCLTMNEQNPGQYASTAECMTIGECLNRLVYVITGQNNQIRSDVFDETGNGCYWNSALTNGLKIRNAKTNNEIAYGCLVDDESTGYKTSFKKIFEGLDRIFCLGWAYEWNGTEWIIRIEPREFFYQNSISQTFPNVGEVRTMAKVDMLANNIQLGYDDKWKNIAVSGQWAIHTDRNYFVNNRAMNEGSSAKLDIKSSIIAEGYAIEFSRRLQFLRDDSGSSDRPNDWETFIIWLNRNELEFDNVEDTAYGVREEAGFRAFPPGQASMSSNLITYSSSPAGNLYNIFHTPARIACRWWKVLGMHTYGLINPRLQFQVGEYQTAYSSAISDSSEPCIQIPSEVTIAENSDIYADIIVPEAAEYLFKPIGVEFSYPQSLCDFLTLSQDEQYRKVRLTSGSLDIQGFITEATNQPEDASGGTTKFILLQANQLAATGAAFDTGFDDGFTIGD